MTTADPNVPTPQKGHVSIVIVNYRGVEDTLACISHVRTLDWPTAHLQIVVVDNASGDGSADTIATQAPDVTLVRSASNTGFAGGCNLGVAHSRGEYIGFINSDARPDASWISAAVAVLIEEPEIGAVASKVLDWDGQLVDYVGGHLNFMGQGYKLEAGNVDDGSYDTPRDVLFPTGSAMVVRTALFREVGGFDERFFMFYEDVDFGWRLNLLGHRVRYVPGSLVFHRHHAAIAKFGSYREQYLLARNSLLTLYKNFSDEMLAKVLAPTLLLAVRNSVRLGGLDGDALDLQLAPGGDDILDIPVSKRGLTGVYAVDFLARNLEALTVQRTQIQASRIRSDAAIAPLFGNLLQATIEGELPDWDATVKAFSLDTALIRPQRVLVATADTLSSRMAGPAIRAFHIADTLSKECEVRLVSTTKCSLTSTGFDTRLVTDEQLRADVDWADIVIFQGFIMHLAPWLSQTDKIIVVDIYDPMHLEQLEQGKADDPVERTANIRATTEVLNQQLRRGDFFLCASEEQRHFWLGQLAGLGRLNPRNYDRDSSLHSLLAVSPFGLPPHTPQRTRPAIKGVVPGIGVDDKVLLWGGGVYNWFDPLTLIRAVDKLRAEHSDLRLFFLGMKHPNPNVPEMQMANAARELSDALGLTNTAVFFNEEWVDYDDRQNYLLDADLGVSTHFLHVETTFSFRTRMLDYLWAGLPIVATGGDVFGRLIVSEGLGVTVDERNVDDLAAGIERAVYDPEFVAQCRANVAKTRAYFTWESTLAPLVEFCRTATRAADAVHDPRPVAKPKYGNLSITARNVAYAQDRFREGGFKKTASYGLQKARRLARRRG